MWLAARGVGRASRPMLQAISAEFSAVAKSSRMKFEYGPVRSVAGSNSEVADHQC
jgi:hypothetical protein